MQQSGLKMAGENLMYLFYFQERKHFLIVEVVGRVEIMI